MLKKDLIRLDESNGRRLGGGGKGFRAQIFEKMGDCSHIYLKVSILAYSMEKHSRRESELKTFERNQTQEFLNRSSLFYRLIETELPGTKLRWRGSPPYGTKLQNCI